jgi:hypothetical protein
MTNTLTNEESVPSPTISAEEFVARLAHSFSSKESASPTPGTQVLAMAFKEYAARKAA